MEGYSCIPFGNPDTLRRHFRKGSRFSIAMMPTLFTLAARGLSTRKLPVPPVITLRPRQNGRHFAHNNFKCIFLNENVWFRLKFHWSFPKDPINNIPALVEMMARCRPGEIDFRLNAVLHYHHICWMNLLINSSSPGENGRQFANDNFKCIFMNENFVFLTYQRHIFNGGFPKPPLK